MAKRKRRRRNEPRLTVVRSFTLEETDDRDLIEWLDTFKSGDRSEMVRSALRAWRARDAGAPKTLDDVWNAVQDLERKLRVGVMVQSGTDVPFSGDEPPEAVAALDALARL